MPAAGQNVRSDSSTVMAAHHATLLFLPFAGLARWSGLSAVGGVEPGPPSRLLRRPGGAVAGAICYELADGQALAAAVRQGAGWLLASANLDPYPLQLQGQYAALA